MRVIVCGMRDWANVEAIARPLSALLKKHGAELKIRHGACYPPPDPVTGIRPLISADWLAQLWCENNHVAAFPVPAEWETYGNAAGPRRNAEMARHGADLCLAFWDGKSAGTGDMVRRASASGIPVRIYPKAKAG